MSPQTHPVLQVAPYPPDTQLIDRFQQGDFTPFDFLYLRHLLLPYVEFAR